MTNVTGFDGMTSRALRMETTRLLSCPTSNAFYFIHSLKAWRRVGAPVSWKLRSLGAEQTFGEESSEAKGARGLSAVLGPNSSHSTRSASANSLSRSLDMSSRKSPVATRA